MDDSYFALMIYLYFAFISDIFMRHDMLSFNKYLVFTCC